jgi:hypothetical protein
MKAKKKLLIKKERNLVQTQGGFQHKIIGN